MTKIQFIGDLHGAITALEYGIKQACTKGTVPDRYIQVGDFGFIWTNRVDARKNLDMLDETLDSPMTFIDGNHENYDLLQVLGCADRKLTHLSELVSHAGRGHAERIGSTDVIFFGGAASVDRTSRTPYVDWWPQEQINLAQVKAMDGMPCDLLVCHDAPQGIPSLERMLKKTEFMWSESALRESHHSRRMLSTLMEIVDPELVIHGHYHHPYQDKYPYSEADVIGLGIGQIIELNL